MTEDSNITEAAYDKREACAQKKKNIHEGHRQRLRESVQKDPELATFSDYTALEYLLSFLIPRKDTNPLAHTLIEQFGSFYDVLTADADRLYEVKHMTRAAAEFLPAILPAALRAEQSRVGRKEVHNTKQAVEALLPYFLDKKDRLCIMMLDVNNRVLSIESIGDGTPEYTAENINLLLAKLSRTQACKVLLAQSRAFDNIKPLPQDIINTENISVIITGMGKELIDHIIFCGDKYFSFFENDILTRVIGVTDKMYNLSRQDLVKNRRHRKEYVLEKANTPDNLSTEGKFNYNKK